MTGTTAASGSCSKQRMQPPSATGPAATTNVKSRVRSFRGVALLTVGAAIAFQIVTIREKTSLAASSSQQNRVVASATDYSREDEEMSTAFPPQCSQADMDTVSFQLPDGDCIAHSTTHPQMNDCSFSFATRCSDAVWWTEQYSQKQGTPKTTARATRASSPPVVIFVGCNKAMDAVNSLRMISNDPAIDRNKWRNTLYAGQKVVPGACRQEFADQFEILANDDTAAAVLPDAVVHYIEAMPVTAARLLNASRTLGWQDRLVVINAAMADKDGTALFPNVANKIGTEDKGLGDCNSAESRATCEEVPMYRLDTFAVMFVKKYSANNSDSPLIDFLSIDAEGYDFEVLRGAPQLLKRSKYLEFEYHWTGTWKNHNLSTAIDMLQASGFVCYWAGAYGNIWRITDCWLEFYNLHAWSNVACVNLGIPETAPLAARMEELFQQTLRAGRSIQYFNSSTATRDGKVFVKAS